MQAALAKIDGVSNAKVVFASGEAKVAVEKGKVSSKELEQAVANIQGGQYKAKAQ